MRVLLIAAGNLTLPMPLYVTLVLVTLSVGRPWMFWYLVQAGIVLGAVQFYVSTGPHTFPMSAMLFVAGLAAFAVTDLSVRGSDWIRRRRSARRHRADNPPERVTLDRGADRDLQRRLAGSVEFRRAVEGAQRQIDG